jgi:hypothetical protein
MFVAVLYAAAGIAASELAGRAASAQMFFFWRLSAFVMSGVVLAAHVGHEHLRLGNSARAVAWRTSLAAALGGFLLALAANIHDLGSATGYRPKMLIALIAWPLLTAVPAFVVALVAVFAVTRLRLGANRQS